MDRFILTDYVNPALLCQFLDFTSSICGLSKKLFNKPILIGLIGA